MEAGLTRVAGNRKLYRRSPRPSSQRSMQMPPPRSQTRYSRGDSALAERIAHTVKGVAGNIAIPKIQFAAEAVEKALHQQDAATPDAARRIRLAPPGAGTGNLKSSGRNRTQHRCLQTSSKKFDPEAVTAALDHLRSLLKASDGDAEDAFLVLQEAVAGHVPTTRLNALSDGHSRLRI